MAIIKDRCQGCLTPIVPGVEPTCCPHGEKRWLRDLLFKSQGKVAALRLRLTSIWDSKQCDVSANAYSHKTHGVLLDTASTAKAYRESVERDGRIKELGIQINNIREFYPNLTWIIARLNERINSLMVEAKAEQGRQDIPSEPNK